MTTETALRNQSADLLKGIAVLLMIQVHLFELFVPEEILRTTFGKVSLFLGGPPAAPLFMGVMGYYLVRSNRTYLDSLKRGGLLIIGGLLLNIGLNANLLYHIYVGKIELDPYAHIFGADILPLAGLSVIIIVSLKQIFKSTIPLYIITAFVAAYASELLAGISALEDTILVYVQSFFWGESYWSYFPIFPWLAYPLLGFSFGLLTQRFPLASQPFQFRIIMPIIVSAGLLLTWDFGFSVSSDLPRYYHHGVLFLTWVIGFLAVWVIFFSLIQKFFAESILLVYARWIGRNVTSAYVFQWLIIGNIATAIYQTQSVEMMPVWFAAVLALTSVLVLAWIKYRRSILAMLGMR